MRWGIKGELSKFNISTKSCLDEIEKCQESSIGPNFIVLQA